MLTNLRDEFATAIAASETAIRINTDEMDDCLKTLKEVASKKDWELRVFDLTVGTRWLNGEDEQKATTAPVAEGMEGLNSAKQHTILAEILKFRNEPAAIDTSEDQAATIRPIILVVKNFHLGFAEPRGAIASAVQHLIGDKLKDAPYWETKKNSYKTVGISGDRDTGKFLVGLMPAESKLPPEIKPSFRIIDHELPETTELLTILDGIVLADSESDAGELTKAEKHRIAKFALGLTRLQAEGIFASSLVKFGRIDPDYVWREKSRVLNEEKLVEVYQGTEKFANVAGLEGAKRFVGALLSTEEFLEGDPDCRPRGVLFCGIPGTGKSLLGKAAGNEFGLPTLMVNPGNWMGSLIGETEQKTRRAFQIIRAHAPCTVICDEVEKVMPKSSDRGGSGDVGARMEGTFLTYMNDMVESVFWVFTANDVTKMHPAFFRAGRVDGVFYVQLPGTVQRAAIWKMYLSKFFPKELKGKAFPQYLPLEYREANTAWHKQKAVESINWPNRFAAIAMTLSDDERSRMLAALAKLDKQLEQDTTDNIVDDTDWTPAEIKSCCQLSRLLKEPLANTELRIRPVARSASEDVSRLEEWAETCAMDAETGQVFVRKTAGGPHAGGLPKVAEVVADGPRRRIRQLK